LAPAAGNRDREKRVKTTKSGPKNSEIAEYGFRKYGIWFYESRVVGRLTLHLRCPSGAGAGYRYLLFVDRPRAVIPGIA